MFFGLATVLLAVVTAGVLGGQAWWATAPQAIQGVPAAGQPLPALPEIVVTASRLRA